jgi:hypothetical protein
VVGSMLAELAGVRLRNDFARDVNAGDVICGLPNHLYPNRGHLNEKDMAGNRRRS